MLRVSYLKLEINEVGCYEAKIGKVKKAGSHRESNPGQISMGSFLMERIFRSTPNGVLTAHAEWLPGVRLRHSVQPVQYT